MKKTLLVFFFALCGNAMAVPVCDYSLDVANATIMVTDNPQVIQQDTTLIRGQNSPEGRCRSYRIFFGKGQANSYQRKAFSSNGNGLNYNLHKSVNKVGILKDINDALNSSEYLEGETPDKLIPYSNSFFVSAPGSDDITLSAGSYYDVVQASIYGFKESGNNFLYETTKNMTLVFIVPKKINVSLLDENGTFDASSTSKVLDFGHITQGDERAADLRVVSNTPYQVKMSSFNNSQLRTPQNAGIAYSLRVNGIPIGLNTSSGNPVTVGGGNNTNAAGDRYNLRVQITGSTENMPAGLYEDAITITAIAN